MEGWEFVGPSSVCDGGRPSFFAPKALFSRRASRPSTRACQGPFGSRFLARDFLTLLGHAVRFFVPLGVIHLASGKTNVQAKAQQLAARGQFDEAIAEWKKLLNNSPDDAATYNTIGDLHLKRKASADAMESFLQAGKAFQAAGAAVKAIAVYKKILKVDPNQLKIYKLLGDLNAERGLVSNAVAEYQTLGNLLVKAGKTRDALEIFRTIINLDSSNLVARRRMAEALLQENFREEAVRAYFDLAQTGIAQNRMDEAKRAFEAILKIDPNNTHAQELLKNPKGPFPDLGELTLPDVPAGPAVDPLASGPLGKAVQQIKDGQYEETESFLTDMLSQEPGNPEICRLLARLHLRRGERAVAMTEFQFLAGAAMRAEDFGLAESMIAEYLEADPDCIPLLELLGGVHERKGDLATAVAKYGKALELLIEKPDPDLPTLPAELYDKIKTLAPGSPLIARYVQSSEAGEAQAAAPAAPAPAGVQAEEAAAGEAVVGEEGHQIHFELGGAYLRMGLLDEAIEELKLAVQGPDCFLDSCLLLSGCLSEQGKYKQAIDALQQALEDARCEGEKADVVRYELGLLYEQEGLSEQAVKVYSAIPALRDVPQRLERLQGAGAAKDGTGQENGLSPAGARSGQESSQEKSAAERKKRRISYM